MDHNNVNAFRHIMWNAISTIFIGSEATKNFTDAHEVGAQNVMDDTNNSLGRSIGENHMGDLFPWFGIINDVKTAISIAGEAYIKEPQNNSQFK